MKNITVLLINLYQIFISKGILPYFLGNQNCRFEPTCSQYSKEAIEKFGFKKGLKLSIKRILNCRPKGGFGFDPVGEK
jgi:putative membrane protein insertion efficiency factor